MKIKINIQSQKKNCGCGKDPCITYGLQKEEKEFQDHKMYDPNSDDVLNAQSEEEHETAAEDGYIHIDPEVIRDILRDEGGAAGIDPFLDSEDIDADEDEIRDALEAMDDVGEHEEGDYILADDKEIIVKIVKEAVRFVLEKRKKRKKKKKKKKAKKDACYNKVKSRYKVWPSAYASGALVKCRKVGAANWGNKSKNKK
tara:strand:- start:183 stop:779 length:597 start_codon:yes stop_codon:yes gene_type:complete